MCVCVRVGNLMVVALADMAGLQKVASFTLNNLFQPGDTIHTTFVEDTANSGVQLTDRAPQNLSESAAYVHQAAACVCSCATSPLSSKWRAALSHH